jgi:hypothetical protein
MSRCFPCVGARADDAHPRAAAETAAASAQRAAATELAQRVAARLGDAPPLTEPAAALSVARRASLRAQWEEQAAAALPPGGTLARHAEHERVRRQLSIVAARIPAVQRAQLAATERPDPDPDPEAGAARLAARLAALGLALCRVDGDGNCQFRALALALHGSAARHGAVRAAAVVQLRRRAAAFAPLFESPHAFQLFCNDMARDATWGDELTLAAAAEAFGVEVHVLQSTADNWHLCYVPDVGAQQPAEQQRAATRRVFVAYVAPVHYDAVVLAAA